MTRELFHQSNQRTALDLETFISSVILHFVGVIELQIPGNLVSRIESRFIGSFDGGQVGWQGAKNCLALSLVGRRSFSTEFSGGS